MSSFNDFFKSQKQRNALALKNSESLVLNEISIAKSAGLVSFTSSDSHKLSKKITEVAHSEEFINSLSNEIGVPKPKESEDEFVSRAKSAMKKLLLDKFGK